MFFFSFILVCYTKQLSSSCRKENHSPLEFVIKSDKKIYKPKDTIKITYTIKNIGKTPVGFYIKEKGNIELEAFDLKGNSLRYYFHPSWQRIISSPYPDRYILLKPGQIYKGEENFYLNKGELKDVIKTSKFKIQKTITVHKGFYIDLPSYMHYDYILIPERCKRIKIRLKFSSTDPNPYNFTVKDCKKAGIPVDTFPEEIESDKISHTIKCTKKGCFNFSEKIYNLAIYCQHKSALSREAQDIKELKSNVIIIEITD